MNFQQFILLIFIMEQDHRQCDDKWIVQLDNLSTFIKEILQFLENYNSFVSKKSPTYRHPLNGYIKVWKLFSERVNVTVKRFKQKKFQVILSTILNWIMPDFATSSKDLFIYIKQTTNQAVVRGVSELTSNDCKEIYEKFKLQSAFQIKNVEFESILKHPFVFIQRFLERSATYSTSLDVRIALLQILGEKGLPSEKKIILQKIQMLRIEANELKTFLKKCIFHFEFLNKSDQNSHNYLNRDSTGLRYDIIQKQYPQFVKSKKILMYGYRLKLICRWKKLEQKRVQRLRERKMKILELIKGQQKYICGLSQYIAQVKDPIVSLELLDQTQTRMLFSSIVEIRDFHKNMLKALQTEYDNYNEKQCYGLILKKFIPFFKLYTDYILNATVAQQYLQDLAKDQKKVAQLCKLYTENTHKIAHNELSQPTFRIARYQALFQGIIKNTSQNHPDCKLLIELLNNFKAILTQVNNLVDKIIRSNRLSQLELEYGSIEPIYAEGREFLREFSLTLIQEPEREQVNLIVCSDLLLIVEEQTHKLMKRIKVDQNFFARREEDNRVYRNMLTIHSDGFITFTSGSDDINANRAEEVYQVLKKITKDSRQQVYVSVIGTEEIGGTTFAKYTEYIIQIKYLDLKKLLHMRFSLISDMVTVMQEYYHSNLKITEAENLKKNWFDSHRAKVIEARKLKIAQVFMKLFNHQIIKNNPKHFLKFINLPENFYDMARYSYEKRISLMQSVTVSGLKRSYLTRKQEKETFTILCGTEIELGRDLFHDMESNEDLKKLKDNAQKIQIQIFTLTEDQVITINITPFDTVQDVCNMVSTLIGLRSNRDFRLFHQIGKKELRVLDHEQILTKIFYFPKQNNETIVGFLQTIKSTFQKIGFPQTLPTLIFKKYYYLPYEIQQTEFRKDLTRMRLMVYQIFSEICEMKYQLNFDDYLLFLAMLIYITLQGQLERKLQIDPSIVNQVIPTTVFKLKNYSQQEWLIKCDHHLDRLHEEIEKVIEYNNQQLNNNKIKADTPSKWALYFGHKHLCSQIVISKIRSNPTFGSNIFYVQPHSSCYKKLQEDGLKASYNMWLAVKIESLNLLTPSSKQSVLELKYSEIHNIQVFSESIVIIKGGSFEQKYRLNTCQSFQINQLYKYNKALNITMAKLKDNSELNLRVRLYRDQLLMHRTTSEGDTVYYSMIQSE